MAQINMVRPRSPRGAALASYGAAGEELRSFTLDGTLSENIEQDTNYTEHPTEDGFSVVDNRVTNPQKVSIDAIITRTPLWVDDATAADPLYLERTLEALESIERNGEEVTVTTSLRAYSKRRISRLSIGLGQSDGDSVRVSFDLIQIRTVTAQVVDVPALPVAPAQKSDAKTETDGGKNTGKDDPPGGAESGDTSAAAKLHDGLVGGNIIPPFLAPGGN